MHKVKIVTTQLIVGSSGTDRLLIEDGSFLLLEDGSKILLE